MKPNLIVFSKLCKEKNIPCRIIHDCGNIVEVQNRGGGSLICLPLEPHLLIRTLL